MDDLRREREHGLSRYYLWDVLLRRKLNRGQHTTPHLGLTAQLFCLMSKSALEEPGVESGDAIISRAVESFGYTRGRQIAANVKSLGKSLSLKNFLIYSDLDTSGYDVKPIIEDGDLLLEVRECPFMTAAKKWGLEQYTYLYCRHIDQAIIRGYNPEVQLIAKPRTESGKDFCFFRYRVKQ